MITDTKIPERSAIGKSRSVSQQVFFFYWIEHSQTFVSHRDRTREREREGERKRYSYGYRWNIIIVIRTVHSSRVPKVSPSGAWRHQELGILTRRKIRIIKKKHTNPNRIFDSIIEYKYTTHFVFIWLNYFFSTPHIDPTLVCVGWLLLPL